MGIDRFYLGRSSAKNAFLRSVNPDISHISGIEFLLFTASDLGVTEKTVTAWFQILVDTLLGELLPCFAWTV
jgi:hypothetical protein